jgi:hypothetical protein
VALSYGRTRTSGTENNRNQASYTLAQIFAINPSKLVGVSVLGSVTLYAYNLEVVPVSGRRRFNIVGQETEAELAKQMFVVPLCSAVGNC